MKTMNEKILLGSVDISDYFLPTIEDKKRDRIKNLLDELEHDRLPFENKQYGMLKSQYLSKDYPMIDLSFLKIPHKLKVGVKTRYVSKGFLGLRSERKTINITVKIPAFAVYTMNRNWFYITDEGRGNLLTINGRNKSKRIPEFMERYILESLSPLNKNAVLNDHRRDNRYYTNVKTPFPKIRKYTTKRINALVSEFNGIIPKRVKEKIREVEEKKLFSSGIYLIAEVKPEEWNQEVFSDDPLIIGLNGTYANLIAHFDTSNLENIVMNTYDKRRLN